MTPPSTPISPYLFPDISPTPRCWGDRGPNPFDPPAGYGVLGVRSPARRALVAATAQGNTEGGGPVSQATIDELWAALPRDRRIQLWHRCEDLARRGIQLAPAVGLPMAMQEVQREYLRAYDNHVSALSVAVGREPAEQGFIRTRRIPQLARECVAVRRFIHDECARLRLPGRLAAFFRNSVAWAA